MPSENNILIMGIPRSGTTLICNLINQLPNCVALAEPLNFTEINDYDDNKRKFYIDEFLRSSRESLINNGIAASKLLFGEIPENPCVTNANPNELRKSRMQNGLIRIEKELSQSFTLVLKHNSGFVAQLNLLLQHYQCFGIIRNPLSVLVSWSSVDMPVHYGFSPIAELFDAELKENLHKIVHSLDRQIYLLCWFFEKLSKNLTEKKIIKYEDLIASDGTLINRIIPFAEIPPRTLNNTNNTFGIDKVTLNDMYNKLIINSRSYDKFYSIDDIQRKYEELLQFI
ncbi:MAG: sulfotransferase domain-containing protein [Bacteroidales bacterium]